MFYLLPASRSHRGAREEGASSLHRSSSSSYAQHGVAQGIEKVAKSVCTGGAGGGKQGGEVRRRGSCTQEGGNLHRTAAVALLVEAGKQNWRQSRLS